MKKKYKLKSWVCYAIMSIFIIGLGYSIFKIVIWKKENDQSKDIVDKINETVKVKEVKPDENTEIINEKSVYWKYTDIPMISVDFTELKKMNKDTIAWINVPGTIVNYPIVQSTNNTYYLSRNFDRERNTGGWIFLDYRNNINELSKNNIIYGHNRKDSSMFGSLKNILKKDWLNNDDYHIVKISTPSYNYVWQVFSVYNIETESYYITTDFKNKEFEAFTDTLLKRSIYDFKTKVNDDDTILTLSTCYNDEKKTVLHAKLIMKEVRSD